LALASDKHRGPYSRAGKCPMRTKALKPDPVQEIAESIMEIGQ
jgi:hypothetical protein